MNNLGGERNLSIGTLHAHFVVSAADQCRAERESEDGRVSQDAEKWCKARRVEREMNSTARGEVLDLGRIDATLENEMFDVGEGAL